MASSTNKSAVVILAFVCRGLPGSCSVLVETLETREELRTGEVGTRSVAKMSRSESSRRWRESSPMELRLPLRWKKSELRVVREAPLGWVWSLARASEQVALGLAGWV